MDTIRVTTSYRMCFGGRDTPPGTTLDLSPATALDVINARRGELVDPNDAQRLRKWATAQGARQSFNNY